jgi:hypothetical protein
VETEGEQHYPAVATGAFGAKGPCEIVIRVRSERERMLRAAKAWGIGWGIAAVTAFIPIAHFILVPTFFLIGPILGFTVYAQERCVVRGTGKCPQCQSDLVIATGSYKDELYGHCPTCRAYVHIALTTTP